MQQQATAGVHTEVCVLISILSWIRAAKPCWTMASPLPVEHPNRSATHRHQSIASLPGSEGIEPIPQSHAGKTIAVFTSGGDSQGKLPICRSFGTYINKLYTTAMLRIMVDARLKETFPK